MARNFNNWLAGFRDSIADYGYYIDFEKVHRNVDGIKVELNILNSLISSKNIKDDFKALIKKYPEVLKCIPLLLAVRANEIYCQDENGGHLYQFDFGKYPPNSHTHYERYSYFMEHTGLFDCWRIISSTILLIMLLVLKRVLILMAVKTEAVI